MSISDCSTQEPGLTVEHVQRKAAFVKRVNSNINKFRDGSKQLARCANRNLYSYDRADVETILAELRRSVDEVEAAFRRVDETPARNASWDLTIAKRARQQVQS